MAKKKAAKPADANPRKKAAKKKAAKPAKGSKPDKASTTVPAPKSVEESLASFAGRVNERTLKDSGYEAADEELFSDITDWIDTGCTPFNVMTWGGLPSGRVIDINGDPSNGKSTLMESTLVGNQARDGENVLLMSEACIDTGRMERQGMNLNRCRILHPLDFEDGAVSILDYLRHREALPPEFRKAHPGVVAWDTPSNAQERHILENPDQQFAAGMASKARAMRSTLRSIMSLASRMNVTILLLFQTHKKIGSVYAGSDTDCGGGPKFAASMRISARQIDKIFTPTMADRDIGIWSEYTLMKSKSGPPPFRTVHVPIRSLDGFDNDLAMFRALQATYVVNPCGECGGRIANATRTAWESEAFKSCQRCNQSGEIIRIIKGNPATVTAEGKSTTGASNQWRYVNGWPQDEAIVFQESKMREALDARPGLRTWLAEQCYRSCTKPTPAKLHPVE